MAANPYTAPQARVADIVDDAEFGPLKLWSASGRIGRLRYLAYTTGASLVVGGLSSVLTLALGPELGLTVTLLAYIPLLVFCVLAAIQRSHDMNWSGWTVLLTIIPLVAFIWLFKSGTEGTNDYGHRPPPNTTGVKILALLFPIIALIGIAAAIAIPAFMGSTPSTEMIQE